MNLGPLTELALALEPLIPQNEGEQALYEGLANRGLAERTLKRGRSAYIVSNYGRMALKTDLKRKEIATL